MRLEALAGQERETSAELVAHLVVLDARPALYASEGFGSLFDYCTTVLRLSEDATCNRIVAARACRRFPVALELMASGALTLTSLRRIGPHLTPENYESVLARASGRRRSEVEALVAEIAPRPDVASTVRRLPANKTPEPPVGSDAVPADAVATPPDALLALGAEPRSATAPTPADIVPPTSPRSSPPSSVGEPPPAFTPTRIAADRPIVQATAPERYRVQFTIGEETHSRLRRLQDLLRREIRSGDPAAIFDRAIALLLEDVEKKKLAATFRSRRSIRSGTDRPRTEMPVDIAAALRTPIVASRHIPSHLKRAVWRRDGGQCAFATPAGQRCPERAFLEFHHVTAYARRGPATVANMSLRCRRHNQYEAELVFGPRRVPTSHPPPPFAP